MKKTRVLSVRLSVEALQSCFDLSELAGHPTSVAGTAISRALTILTANLRDSGKLPLYSPTELDRLTERWASKINPSSMPSLELSSQAESLRSFTDAEKIVPAQQASFDPPIFAEPKIFAEEQKIFEPLNLDELSLEEEILKQMKEVELEDELDLLDKILIS